MQELLCIADMLITDYSSSMFDFAMLRKPCILYATDVAQYDRGYYFNFKHLPFPLAESENELLSILKDFNEEKYLSGLEKFYEETIGLYEDGHASESIACWMRNHRS
jgi:CDP-glycerol glycerophosphotransferase